MDNPNPVPLPTSLVVKKGSNNLERIFSGIPGPLSEMLIAIQSLGKALVIIWI